MIVAVPVGLLIYTMYEDGAFETTKNSVLILVAGVNRFRRIGQEDLAEVEEMGRRNREAAEKIRGMGEETTSSKKNKKK